MESLEDSVHGFTVEYIKRMFRDINTNLLRKFNQMFKKDENGKNRDWSAMEDAQIRELWQSCRLYLEEIITDNFKFIPLAKHPLTDNLSNPLLIYVIIEHFNTITPT